VKLKLSDRTIAALATVLAASTPGSAQETTVVESRIGNLSFEYGDPSKQTVTRHMGSPTGKAWRTSLTRNR
jgi:hypothetical protein